MADKDVLGRAGEDRAAGYLTANGYDVVDRNWRCRIGEIDIVAVRGPHLVVVEVKTRRGTRYGHPLEALDERKRARLWRLGMAWAADHPDAVRGRRIRLDAIAITGPDPSSGELEHLEDLW